MRTTHQHVPTPRANVSLAAVVAVSFLMVGPAFAQPVYISELSTYDLAETCKASKETLSTDFCTGYIVATFDRMSLTRAICPTGSAMTGRAVAVARKYIADHPERWGEPPVIIVAEALKTAFACRTK